MRHLIIGSYALNRITGRQVREPKDLDIFDDADVGYLKSIYGDVVEPFWHPSFNEWLPEGTCRAATLDELYTLKVSHSYWELRNGSWEKHIRDAMMLKAAGATLDANLHQLLYNVWEDTHGKKKVNLDQDAMDFFSDAVSRKYEHDSIHDSVAYGERPMWESFLVPGETVKMDMAAIKAAPFTNQVKLFREEVYATALERWIIPSDYRTSPRAAYAKALRKTITSLTKGWSATFLVTNFDVFCKPDIDYVKHHKSKSHLLRYLVDESC